MYLDPGTGSILLQAIIGAVLSIGVFLRLFGKKIKSFFGKENTPENTSETTEVN